MPVSAWERLKAKGRSTNTVEIRRKDKERDDNRGVDKGSSDGTVSRKDGEKRLIFEDRVMENL